MTKIKEYFCKKNRPGVLDMLSRLLLSILLFIFLSTILLAEEMRLVRDDVGFCWEKDQIERLIDYLESLPPASNQTAAPAGIIAGISPHDDYLYAARIYYPLFKHLKTKEVVIFGVTHGAVREKIGDPRNVIIFDEYKYWKGPYREVQVSGLRDFLKTRLDEKQFIVDNEAHRLEHSIEALIPFLQYYNREIKITPIMVTGMNFNNLEKVSTALAEQLAAYIEENNLQMGSDIFFMISSDANHYGRDFNNIVYGENERAHKMGTGTDKQIAETFLSGVITGTKIAELTGKIWGTTYAEYGERVWCGKFSIPFGLLTILKTVEKTAPGSTLKGKILVYSDTYTEGVLPLKNPGYGITAPFSFKHWVGFFSAGFYL
ncbi:MAG: AmmeMemoRadiSam system protein B, partial [Candidatus Aminicenantes bacterium]|nr:AmmeMemoRadiSam system protein B [Candidatus Aminicenantes bacterium]